MGVSAQNKTMVQKGNHHKRSCKKSCAKKSLFQSTGKKAVFQRGTNAKGPVFKAAQKVIVFKGG